MGWQSYKEKILDLSKKIVEAQRPIRILNSIQIPSEIGEEFRRSKFKEIPKLTPEIYHKIPIGLDPQSKRKEFQSLRDLISQQLGESDDLTDLLQSIVDEYLLVIDLLESRGTPRFNEISQKLYGSPFDPIHSDKNSIFQMSKLLYSILGGIKNTLAIPNSEKTLTAAELVEKLNHGLGQYFHSDQVCVEISDGILSDAAAGGDKIRIRADRKFSIRDLKVLEVHEGWVHVGTTLNGRKQKVAQWLSVGSPRVTSTQEGLAVLMEIFSFRTSVARAQRINDRIMAIAKAHEGANLLEVFEFFRTEGYEESECISNSFRVFRGSYFEGKPFTKDISYCKGFVENYNFLRAAIRANKPDLIPLLFVGKIYVDDIPLLYRLQQEGVIDPPKYLPREFSDINGIAVWMSFSSFFNKVDLKKVQHHYNQLFTKFT